MIRNRWFYWLAGWGLGVCPGVVWPQHPTNTIGVSNVIVNMSDDYQLAAAAYQREEWDEAVRRFDQVLLSPLTPVAERGLANFFRAEALVQLNQPQAARASFQQFLRGLDSEGQVAERERVITARFRIAQIAWETADNNAVHLLESFLQEFPESPYRCSALTSLGERRISRKEYRLAQRVLETALGEFPHDQRSDWNRLHLATSLTYLGNFDGARSFLVYLAEHADSDSLRTRARMQLAICETYAKRHEVAVSILNDLIDQHSGSAIPMAELDYWLATNELNLQHYLESLKLYDGCLSQLTGSDLEKSARINRAIALLKLGNSTAASDAFDELDARQMTNGSLEYWLSPRVEAAFAAQRFEQVIELTKQANLADLQEMESRRLIELRGRALYAKENFTAAREAFQALLTDGDSKWEQWPQWNYLLALSLLSEKRWEEAESVLATVPDHRWSQAEGAKVNLLRGHLQRHLGQPEAAAAFYCRAWLAADQLTPDEQRSIATPMLEQGLQWQDLAWAEYSWEMLLATLPGPAAETGFVVANSPDHEVVLQSFCQQLGDLAFQQGQFSTASRYYQHLERLASTPPTRARALAGQGWAALELGDTAQAYGHFTDLIELAPSSPHSGNAALILAQKAIADQDYSQAVNRYELALRLAVSPEQQQPIMWGLAGALKRTGLQLDRTRAIELLEQLMHEKPAKIKPAQILFELAWLYREQQDLQRSRELLQQIVGQHESSPLWSDAAYRIALAKFQAGQHGEAEDLVARILGQSLTPVLLSRVQYLAGQLASARQDWRAVQQIMTTAGQAAQDDPGQQFRCRYWQAEACYQLQQFAEAEQLYSGLTQNNGRGSTVDQALMPWVWLRFSQCLVMRDGWDEALEAASIGQERFQDFPWSYEFDFVAGRALFGLGRSGDALRSLQLVIDAPAGRRTETAAQAQWRMGEIYFHQERYVEAIDAYYRVDALFPFDHWRAAALLQAGKCQELLGNWGHAIKLYQQILEKFPNTEFVEAARQRLDIASRQAKLNEIAPIR